MKRYRVSKEAGNDLDIYLLGGTGSFATPAEPSKNRQYTSPNSGRLQGFGGVSEKDQYSIAPARRKTRLAQRIDPGIELVVFAVDALPKSLKQRGRFSAERIWFR